MHRATKSFYEKAYGWKFEQFGEDMGNYVMGTLPSGATLGIRPPQNEHEKPGVLNYILVKDIKKSLTEAKHLGAHVILEPMEIPGMGWMAVFLVHGVPNAIWQTATPQ